MLYRACSSVLGGPDEGIGTRPGYFLEETGIGIPICGTGIIRESVLNQMVVIEIDFGTVVVLQEMELEAPGDSTTEVSWVENLTFGNPLVRYLPLCPKPFCLFRNQEHPFLFAGQKSWGSSVETRGFEPLTSAVRSQRSTN